MTLEEQLAYIRKNMPEAWEYLQHKAELPKYDDNDEVIHYWGGTLSTKEGK